ncbi:MAG: hypothetical protein JWM34_4005 [Ilumatobacteraceae bacterium]|nr:hypothetical protein [Ilumatobacteraceae bacterium]
MIRQKKLVALAAVGAIALAACSSDSKSSDTTKAPVATTATTTATSTADTTATSTASSSADTTGTSTADTTGTSTASSSADTTGTSTADTTGTSTAGTDAASEGWKVDTSTCSDPSAASAAITGTLTIGSAMPLSVSPAAAAFAPVKDGFDLYFKYANDNNLVPGITLKSDVQDDQYDATITPGVVSSLIDSGASIFSGIIGTADNEAVRDTLNQECIPQLLNLSGAPEFGNDVADYPWTTMALVPYDIEAKVYANALKKQIGDGGTVGMFTVNSEFGKTFADAFRDAAKADGLNIVEEQTIEETDSNPPTNQVGAIAAKKPAAVVAVPLGAQCPTFLKEMQNAEAATPDWKPFVYQTNTCASRLLISALAGDAGTGVYTSGYIVDPQDPTSASVPGVKTFTDAYNAAALKGDIGTTAVGWTIAELTTDIIIQAQKSGTLSRESIINAARNMTITPSLARPGVVYKMNGEKDGFSLQSLQVEQWNNANNAFTNIGDTDSSFES